MSDQIKVYDANGNVIGSVDTVNHPGTVTITDSATITRLTNQPIKKVGEGYSVKLGEVEATERNLKKEIAWWKFH